MVNRRKKKKLKNLSVDLKKPYLGFCLGCQLLGEVVGGKVVKSKPAEIGIMDINFSKEKIKIFYFHHFQIISKVYNGIHMKLMVLITIKI